MGQCMSTTHAVDADMECVNKVLRKENPCPLTPHQEAWVGGSIKDTRRIQDVPRARTAAAEPATQLPGSFTVTATTAGASAASICHPAEQPAFLDTSDKTEGMQQTPAAGNHPHDSASSTPRTSADYSSNVFAPEADITATTSPVDRHPVPTATATITITPAHTGKTKGFMPISAAAELGRRLREEQSAKSAAESALAVCAVVAAHLARQLSAEQDMCRAAEDAAGDKHVALLAAEELVADLEHELITQQQAHAAEEGALRAKLAAAEQQAADLARQVSTQQEAAQQAQAAAAAKERDLQWDLAAAKWRVGKLERDIDAEQDSRRKADELLGATLQQALLVEQRVSELETALQATQQQAAEAQARCLASFRHPVFPQGALVGPPERLGSGAFGVNQRHLAEEATLMSECRHENILPLVAEIQDGNGGLSAIAMPRGDRDLFAELLKRGETTGSFALEPKRVKEIGQGLASALYYLHNTAHIIHHDIKLGNIVIMADGMPKVADFGLSLRIPDSGWPLLGRSGSGQGCRVPQGTPMESIHPYSTLCRWMPGPHDDVWGLCMILQLCVSGRPLAKALRDDLNRRLATDPAGLAEVDAVCSKFGLLEPTENQRLAALQLIWPLQIQPRETGMDDLVQLLQLLLSPGLDRAYCSPAEDLSALYNTLTQIPDYPAPPAPEPARLCAAAPNTGAAPGPQSAQQPQPEPLQPIHSAGGVQDDPPQWPSAPRKTLSFDAEDSCAGLAFLIEEEE
ncbi:probable serine/threonine-protein kinase 33 at C-terminar half [Coccomyxa sp. Obi]|nr:probable serine/threonine-protein kinase 33 at C-terminar half [Coccomyxa sp. Obi]